MDWLANLGLKESDIDFTPPEICPQYPQNKRVGGIGDIIPSIETEKQPTVMPTDFYNGGCHDPFYGDAEFILSELLKYPTELRKLISAKYSQRYQHAYVNCKDEIKQDNEARRYANVYLLRQRANKAGIVE